MVAGNIETVEADVAGICANNASGAIIEDCKNSATLKQTSSHNEWNPTVAGIVLENFGAVVNSRNVANLQVVSNNQFDNAAGSANLGGVAGYNYGEINKCKNTGNLNVKTKNIIAYCGGIVADSEHVINKFGQIVSIAKVLNCGVECEIDVETEHDKALIFSGGIAGFLMGEMDKCFSIVDFKTKYDKDKCYVGIALGATYYEYWDDYFWIDGKSNYVLMFEGVPYQIGASLTSGEISAIGIELLDGRIITETYSAPRCNICDIYTCQRAAKTECTLSNRSNAVGNGDACQRVAPIECPLSNLSNAVGNGYTCQRGAITECFLSNPL
jgi:hypothetical protein